jgi:hypothetical protein
MFLRQSFCTKVPVVRSPDPENSSPEAMRNGIIIKTARKAIEKIANFFQAKVWNFRSGRKKREMEGRDFHVSGSLFHKQRWFGSQEKGHKANNIQY